MDSEPAVRLADGSESERIQEIAESSMTASYAMSPDDIDALVEAEFAAEKIREQIAGAERELFVAEVDDVVAGFVELTAGAEVRWLHVDPERRGRGVGTALFERARSELDERGSGLRAVTLASSTSAGTFFERFALAQVAERQTEIAGRTLVEYVYTDEAEAAEAGESTDEIDRGSTDEMDRESAEAVDTDLPDEVDGEDGTEYLGDDPLAGSEGYFLQTYGDAARTDEHGYYCANCGVTDVSMDSMDRIQCTNCGNTHKPGKEYDASYL
ncbi:GNAT family N-acetyltransferase [Haloarchaeobius sp. DFWS5]|uniref:GNAT family N-acetyltransferase n=1 Tax=Haloarchaeobius sp. DFWS5 TaxID=3446114 RepID=UPI003EBCA7D5